jgi:hypothetical protein
MNLLEICREIIRRDEQGCYKHLKDTYLGFYSPDICRALVAAMEEIESESKVDVGFGTVTDIGLHHALEILHKHLEVEK